MGKTTASDFTSASSTSARLALLELSPPSVITSRIFLPYTARLNCDCASRIASYRAVVPPRSNPEMAVSNSVIMPVKGLLSGNAKRAC